MTFVDNERTEQTQIFHDNQFSKKHVTAPGKRPGKNMNRKKYKDVEVKRGEVFIEQTEVVEITLGDPKVNHGFWRAIEHMRRGEKSRVMVKPAWGYAMADYAD